jgi:DNA-binding response OmpR family regulator
MNQDKNILVVDDEKNLRFTMVHALETSGFHVESAITGEEALLMLKASPFDLVFLDLKMPGIDGLEVLRQTKQSWPMLRVVVVTAHGTVDNAVEAMKLGAADFIQKPFTPEEIRELTKSVLLPLPKDAHTAGYTHCMAEARRSIVENQLATAIACVRKAVGLDPTRPEAFNLLGAAVHLSGQRYKAQDYFRAAIALDPTYGPAHENLERSVVGGVRGLSMELSLGDGSDETK